MRLGLRYVHSLRGEDKLKARREGKGGSLGVSPREFLLVDRILGLALSKATDRWVQYNVSGIVLWHRCSTCNMTGPSG